VSRFVSIIKASGLQSSQGDLSGSIGGFKSYTSKKLIQYIEHNHESRPEWLLNVLKKPLFHASPMPVPSSSVITV